MMQMSAQTITRYEYWTGNDHSHRATVINSADNINIEISTDGMDYGLQILNFRVQNSEGEWSPIQRMLYFIPSIPDQTATLTDYEWWLDDSRSTINNGQSYMANIKGLNTGLHCLNFRARNSNGDWSPIHRMLFVIPPIAETTATLTDWEWWIDNDLTSVNRGNGNHEKMAFTYDIGSLSVGLHCLNYRVRNSHGDWSPIARYLFYKPDELEKAAQITQVEYWLDEDYSKVFRMSSQMDVYSISMDISSLSVGVHTVNFRTKNSNGEWNPVSRYLFYVPDAPDETDSPYTGYYYAFSNHVKYESIGEMKEFEMKNQVFVIPDLLDIGDMESGCSFVIDKQKKTIELNRTQNVNFSLWFSKKDGTSSYPVRTTFEMSDKQIRDISLFPIGLNKTVDKLRSGDFFALSFDVLFAQNLEFLASSPCMVRLFNSEGHLLSAISVGERWLFPTITGSYYMVISNSAIAKESLDDQLTIALRPANIIPDESDDLQAYLNSLYDTQDVLTGDIYTRQFLNTDWQSLYVPFTLEYSDWADMFDIASLSKFCQYDDDKDGDTDRQELEAVVLRSNSDKLKANTPYLIRAKVPGTYKIAVEASNFVSENVNTVIFSAGDTELTVTGNYVAQNGLKSMERYRLLGGSLSLPGKDEEVLPPYRWYATIENSDKAKVRITFVDDVTGIESINVDAEEMIGERRVYDLSGRRINISKDTPIYSIPKGVYIINNKKYIIK